jgi:ABC-type polar amino acid transport system ATPase subunit
MLKIKNVSFTYPNGKDVLKDVNLDFPREHILALLGKSGSGKTTLLKCIGRFLRVKKGEILLAGKDIYQFKEKDFRRYIGIVFQGLYLFPHLSVFRNMTLALEVVTGKERRKAAEQAEYTLDKLGIEDIKNNYPSEISGGQAQRVAIARALLLRPEYLLLDEPTSALDAETSNELGDWLYSLKSETTFIIVSHDILFCNRIAKFGALIEEGTIVSKGNIGQILQDK